MSTISAKPKSAALRFVAPAALLLVTGLISVYAYRGANAADPPPPIASAPTAELQAEPTAAIHLAMQHASRLAPAATVPGSAVFPNLAAGLAQLHRGSATVAVKPAERDRAVSQLDSQHDAETIDPVWSATSEQGLVAASVSPVMAQAGFHPQGVTTDCRSNSCRISARFSSSSEARDWADRLLTQMAGTISQAKVAVLPREDGSYEVKVYGARRHS